MPKPSKKRQNASREYEKMYRIIQNEAELLPTYNIGFSFNDKYLPKTVEEAWDRFLTWALVVDEHLGSKNKPPLRYVAVLEEAPDGNKRFHFHGLMFLSISYNQENMGWLYGIQDEVKRIKDQYSVDKLTRYIIKEWQNHDRKDHTCFRTNIFSHFTKKEMEHKLRAFSSENWEDLSINEPFHYSEELNIKYFATIFEDMVKFCKENDLPEFTPEEYKTCFDTEHIISSSEDTEKTPENQEKNT